MFKVLGLLLSSFQRAGVSGLLRPQSRRSRGATKRRSEAHLADRVFYGILKFLSWSMIVMVIGIVAMIAKMAWPVLAKFGLGFFVGSDWNPPMESFGSLPFIYGTLVTSLIAIIIAAPISIGVALFLTELAPRWLSKLVGFLVEMLAAIPSVVYGLWGIFVLAPFMQATLQPMIANSLGPETVFAQALGPLLTIVSYPFVLIANGLGFSHTTLESLSEHMNFVASHLFGGPQFGVGMLTAGIVLAIMITPTISAISREVFVTVNISVKEAALALGATRWEMMKMAVIKTSRSGLVGAVILGLGRALGETMAVTMVIGNRNDITASLMAPGQTMASVIANEYGEASGLHMAALAGVGLSLFAVSLVINSAARLIIWRVDRNVTR